MFSLVFQNFTAAARKANLIRFGLFPVTFHLESIDAASGMSGAGYMAQALTGAINGTTGSDGNAMFTYVATGLPADHFLFKNGQKMLLGASYLIAFAGGTVTITFLAPYIPLALDSLELKIA